MNDMTHAAGIGHNQPPATMADELASRYQQFVDAAQETLDACMTVPARVDDDDTAGKIAELAKKMRTTEKALEDAFDAEKAPHQLKITAIQGFFKTWIERLAGERKRVATIGKDYSDRKAAEKKRQMEEEAERKRLEQAKKEREAADAEQTAAAARAALGEFERLERDAADAKTSAVSEQELAAAEVARCEAVLAKVKADNSALAAEFARRVTEGNPASDEEKAEKRAEADSRLKAARADLEAARGLLAEAREKARAAREAARKAQDEADAKAAEVKRAEREQKHAETEAAHHERQADRLETKAQADDPSMGSTRSIHGALQTSMRVWKHEITDVNALDKEALWNLLNLDAIEAAVGRWMKLQPQDKRVMAGARFWEEDVAVIR